MLKKVLVIAFLFIEFLANATHNRAGYISYTYMGNGMYRFRIYTYTNLASIQADRCQQTLYIDNTDSVVCPRVNGPIPCPNANTGHDGITIVPTSMGYGGVKANIYEGQYALNAGVHVLTMIDPNRDGGIINLGGSSSSNIAFALVDTVYLWPFVTGAHNNSTPVISNPPIQNACAGQNWCYNPGAIDPENDSLNFSIINSFEGDPSNPPGGVMQIGANETIPPNVTVDPQTGNLCWTPVASQTGEYNVALLIKEYRRTINGTRVLVGETVFDIQIYVVTCPPTNITFNVVPHGGCVVAGQTFITSASASGNGTTAPMHINATGLPLSSTQIGQNAVFDSIPSANSASGTFSWTPQCAAVSLSPYYITFQAFDSHTPLANAAFATANIHVIAPPPTNLTASSISGVDVVLNWTAPATCGTETVNPIVKYLIYRVSGCTGSPPDSCRTGVPPSMGYILVGTFNGNTPPLTFTDNNFGLGLSPGSQYSYIIVAQFADGSLSQASVNKCVTIKLDLPLMMKVSVDTTDPALGQMTVWWKNPFVDTIGETSLLDTNVNRAPYKYILQRKPAIPSTATYTPIYTVNATSFKALTQNVQDTTFTDTNLDTQDKQYIYKVDFYACSQSNTITPVYMGSSPSASSIFLTAIPHDNKVILNWNVQVPWGNYMYIIWQQNFFNSGYHIIDTAYSTSDTITGLVNKWPYCFKVQSIGKYSSALISFPIINFSEKVCATPIDDVPPCQPKLTVSGNCSTSVNQLVWTDPNHACHINDVVKYVIYFSPYKDSSLVKIDSISNPLDTAYTTDFSASIAGCYVIVAVDSVGNRSPLTNETCTDNCPEYELPNIFTPNGDNLNDQYIPVKNKYIKDVKFTMFNRWGEIVFETTDPALHWDGKTQQMQKPASDGTYYYLCQVDELHYYGIKSRMLKGFVQLIR